MAVAGFVLAVVCAVALARFGQTDEHTDAAQEVPARCAEPDPHASAADPHTSTAM
jgi:hypothetical protein